MTANDIRTNCTAFHTALCVHPVVDAAVCLVVSVFAVCLLSMRVLPGLL